MEGALAGLDRRLGDAVEGLTRAHHRRRLSRVGWQRALDPPGTGLWCQGEPPPRPGNALDVLIDGAAALPRIAAALAAAESYVHIAGWHVDAGFRLGHEPGAPTVGGLLAQLADRIPVRVLVWAGAPIPVFKPTRADVRRGRDQLCRDTRIDCVVDSHERPAHCHHEKLVVIDGKVAFVGGIDLTGLGGDRYDRNDHPYRPAVGWHDAAVCIHGPAVADVADHFRSRWQEVSGERLDPPVVPDPAGDVELQLVRTIPEHVYEFARNGEFRILEAYSRALRSAERLVYLENQFLWSPELVAILADKLRRPPTPDFRVVVLLPARANNGADDTKGQLGVLIEADAGAGRLVACTLYSRDPATARSSPVYVHAKIGIVDDTWLTLGSANLNAHSLFNDSEVNIVTHDPGVVSDVRHRLWAEHLERSVDAVSGDPTRVIDELWKPLAAASRRQADAGETPEHRLTMLSGLSRRAERLLGPLQGLMVDG
ncbi:MAG TPA: phospholipase D-like domain-containing protein [Solirubrobacteraceae bacterium]|nr:phospholipase D-like domain-containing protein [Solirubrobacteraceae bacterium]